MQLVPGVWGAVFAHPSLFSFQCFDCAGRGVNSNIPEGRRSRPVSTPARRGVGVLFARRGLTRPRDWSDHGDVTETAWREREIDEDRVVSAIRARWSILYAQQRMPEPSSPNGRLRRNGSNGLCSIRRKSSRTARTRRCSMHLAGFQKAKTGCSESSTIRQLHRIES